MVLDANGVPQPGLATSWDYDSAARIWNFHLRPGVRFQDGSPLTPDSAASALANIDPSWHVSSSADACEHRNERTDARSPISSR